MLARSRLLLLIFVLGAFSLVMCQTTARAQKNECGKLTIDQCAILYSAQSNWNERFSQIARFESFDYVGPAQPEGIRSLYQQSGNYVVYSDADGKLASIAPASDAWAKASDAQRESLGSQLQQFAHAAQFEADIQWSSREGPFTTRAYVLNTYPFIIDTMLSSVAIIETRQHSCELAEVYWIFGPTRGEFEVSINSFYDGGRLHCGAQMSGYMVIGNLTYQAKDIEYGAAGNRCWYSYAYAFSTPIGSVSIAKEDLSMKISGIGSVVKGSNICRSD